MKTDNWFYGLFQSAPDLIALLLPMPGAVVPSLEPDAPGDALYRFDAPELKAANHRLDGAFWPRNGEAGTAGQPVVLLEVVVVVPHRRLKLGPDQLPRQLQAFLDRVIWLSLEELGQQADLDPLLALLTLPVRPEAELKTSTQQILERRPDLLSTLLTMLFERFPTFTPEEIMVIAGIPTDQLLHTRAAQILLDRGRREGEARGRQEGEAQGEAKVTMRLLNRRCGPLSDTTTARIQALPLEQLETLAEALLDFSGPADLAAWLDGHCG